MALLFAIGAVFYSGSLRETVGLGALARAIGLGGVLLIAYYRNTIIKFDGEKIKSQNILGKTTNLFWREVTAVQYNKISNVLVLKTPAAKIVVSSETVGSASFVEALRKHLKPEVYEAALAEISQE